MSGRGPARSRCGDRDNSIAASPAAKPSQIPRRMNSTLRKSVKQDNDEAIVSQQSSDAGIAAPAAGAEAHPMSPDLQQFNEESISFGVLPVRFVVP